MAISQKCQYALRAIYELALHQDEGPCKIGAIAEAQSIPVRFIENILNSLKAAGFVDSVRGKDGGYYLLRKADEITVGEVIRFVRTAGTGRYHELMTAILQRLRLQALVGLGEAARRL